MLLHVKGHSAENFLRITTVGVSKFDQKLIYIIPIVCHDCSFSNVKPKLFVSFNQVFSTLKFKKASLLLGKIMNSDQNDA